jgi:starvation-inducible DNA-binding protein
MSQTAQELRVVLSNIFVLYFQTHSYHWNVRGPLFYSMHQFLGALHLQVFAEVDVTAEQIRALGEMAPASLDEMLNPCSAVGIVPIPYEVNLMLTELIRLNESVLASLYRAHDAAAEEQHDGVVNFIHTTIYANANIDCILKIHLE